MFNKITCCFGVLNGAYATERLPVSNAERGLVFSEEEQRIMRESLIVLNAHLTENDAISLQHRPRLNNVYDEVLQVLGISLSHELKLAYPDDEKLITHWDEPIRYTRDDFKQNTASQSKYVHHVFGLMKLRQAVSKESLTKFLNREMTKSGIKNNPAARLDILSMAGSSAADVIRYLYDHYPPLPGQRNTRNTALTSVFLETLTGIIYHPTMNLVREDATGVNIPSPLNKKHPGGFQHFPFTMLERYVQALTTHRVKDFFDSAFIQQRPCYEDIQENMLNFSASQVIQYSMPSWNNRLSVSENFDGLFACAQRDELLDYLRHKRIDPQSISPNEIDAVESSVEFSQHLSERFDDLYAAISFSVPDEYRENIAIMLKQALVQNIY